MIPAGLPEKFCCSISFLKRQMQRVILLSDFLSKESAESRLETNVSSAVPVSGCCAHLTERSKLTSSFCLICASLALRKWFRIEPVPAAFKKNRRRVFI
jgi:hypothetical protein